MRPSNPIQTVGVVQGAFYQLLLKKRVDDERALVIG
jgi:hypothetical protein